VASKEDFDWLKSGISMPFPTFFTVRRVACLPVVFWGGLRKRATLF